MISSVTELCVFTQFSMNMASEPPGVRSDQLVSNHDAGEKLTYAQAMRLAKVGFFNPSFYIRLKQSQ